MTQLHDSVPDDWGPTLELELSAVSATKTGPAAIRFNARAHCVLVMLSSQARRHVALNSDRTRRGSAPVGSLEIVPQGSELFAQWDGHKENLLAALSQERIRRLAGQEFEHPDFEWHPPALGKVDPKALVIARSIREELHSGAHGAHECVDALLTVLGIHVLRRYSSLGAKPAYRPRGGLAPASWRRVEDFIHSHLPEKLGVERLAQIAGLSPSHFARAFRETSGQSPHQYVLATRIETARRLILERNGSFEQIAQRSGFSSNSHMTFTMVRALGVGPTEIRRSAH
jgi:AraC family transcriptional regulator